MDAPNYYKDGVARVLELLKNTFGDDPIKGYFNGQPNDIPESMLPAIMVSETAGRIDSGATGTDRITETILIVIAMNKKDDLGAPADIDLTEFKLRKLVKGQDPITMEYLPQTVMYAIRKHITMDDAVLNSSISTDFDVQIRGSDTVTQEAYVEVTLERLALIPSRD